MERVPGSKNLEKKIQKIIWKKSLWDPGTFINWQGLLTEGGGYRSRNLFRRFLGPQIARFKKLKIRKYHETCNFPGPCGALWARSRVRVSYFFGLHIPVFEHLWVMLLGACITGERDVVPLSQRVWQRGQVWNSPIG